MAFICHVVVKWNGNALLGNRQLVCVNYGLNISRCALHEEGRETELNPGCFDELDSVSDCYWSYRKEYLQNNNTRVYCRLSCEESDETTVLSKTPSWNHECSTQYTYHLERRRRDW